MVSTRKSNLLRSRPDCSSKRRNRRCVGSVIDPVPPDPQPIRRRRTNNNCAIAAASASAASSSRAASRKRKEPPAARPAGISDGVGGGGRRGNGGRGVSDGEPPSKKPRGRSPAAAARGGRPPSKPAAIASSPKPAPPAWSSSSSSSPAASSGLAKPSARSRSRSASPVPYSSTAGPRRRPKCAKCGSGGRRVLNGRHTFDAHSIRRLEGLWAAAGLDRRGGSAAVAAEAAERVRMRCEEVRELRKTVEELTEERDGLRDELSELRSIARPTVAGSAAELIAVSAADSRGGSDTTSEVASVEPQAQKPKPTAAEDALTGATAEGVTVAAAPAEISPLASSAEEEEAVSSKNTSDPPSLAAGATAANLTMEEDLATSLATLDEVRRLRNDLAATRKRESVLKTRLQDSRILLGAAAHAANKQDELVEKLKKEKAELERRAEIPTGRTRKGDENGSSCGKSEKESGAGVWEERDELLREKMKLAAERNVSRKEEARLTNKVMEMEMRMKGMEEKEKEGGEGEGEGEGGEPQGKTTEASEAHAEAEGEPQPHGSEGQPETAAEEREETVAASAPVPDMSGGQRDKLCWPESAAAAPVVAGEAGPFLAARDGAARGNARTVGPSAARASAEAKTAKLLRAERDGLRTMANQMIVQIRNQASTIADIQGEVERLRTENESLRQRELGTAGGSGVVPATDAEDERKERAAGDDEVRSQQRGLETTTAPDANTRAEANRRACAAREFADRMARGWDAAACPVAGEWGGAVAANGVSFVPPGVAAGSVRSRDAEVHVPATTPTGRKVVWGAHVVSEEHTKELDVSALVSGASSDLIGKEKSISGKASSIQVAEGGWRASGHCEGNRAAITTAGTAYAGRKDRAGNSSNSSTMAAGAFWSDSAVHVPQCSLSPEADMSAGVQQASNSENGGKCYHVVTAATQASLVNGALHTCRVVSPHYTCQDPTVVWRHLFCSLCEFHARFGHTRVPPGWAEIPSLDKWVHTQQMEYIKYRNGYPTFLTPEMISCLEAIGFAERMLVNV